MTSSLPPARLAKMAALFDRFAALKASQRKMRYDRMSEFLKLFQERHYKHLTTGPADFNLFNALKVADYEIRHSAFLAWLLDARAGHKQGTRFLRHFLEACEIDDDLGSRVLPLVHTEYRERRAFIDIMVHIRGELLIYIENKVGAPEGDRQLISEFLDMRELGARIRVPEDRQYAVFLTPYGREPETDKSTHWHRLSYGKLAASFSAILPDIASDKLRYVVGDWIAIAQRIGGNP